MKKIAIILLSILVAGMFIACNQDVTVDAQVHANIELGTFVLDGKNYATLQEAVNAKLGKGLSKGLGDNDGVIYLTRNSSGPGAVINSAVTGGVTIDFAGYTYSFTNVTGLQGGEAPKPESFGLAVTNGAQVTLKGMEKIDLNDKSTSALTMVYIEGAETKLSIESAPKMVVEPEQYVFWAANGATLTIGGETQVAGGVAATGSTTEESKPTITLKGNSSVTGSINATSAKVNVEETSKIEASVVASENTTVIVNSENNVITTLDKTTDSTVIITEKVQINDVTGEDKEVVIAGDGEVVDASGAESKDVEPSTQKTYAAMVGTDLYETFTEALEAVGEEGELFLLADLNENITIPEAMSLKFNFGSYNIGTSDAPVDITVNGDFLYVTGSGYFYIYNYTQAANTTVVLDGGTYTFDKNGTATVGTGAVTILIEGKVNLDPEYYFYVPAFCEVTNNGDGTWTVSRVKEEDAVASITIEEETLYFKTLEAAFDSADDGQTIILLTSEVSEDYLELDSYPTKSVVFDLNGLTLTTCFDIDNISLEIKNGTLSNSYCPVYLNEQNDEGLSKLIIDADATVTGDYSVILYGSDTANGMVLDVYGNVNGVVWVMGNITAGNSEINVYKTASMTSSDLCIANQGYVTTTIYDGAQLTGYDSAIEARSGIVNIKGGTFTATSEPASSDFNNNGTTTVGTVIAVAPYGNSNLTVKIEGGTFTGYTAAYLSDPNGTKKKKVNTFITSGGVFNGSNSAVGHAGVLQEFMSSDTGIIGGTFSSDPSAYVADGYGVVYNLEDKVYEVKELWTKGLTPYDSAENITINTAEDFAKFALTVNNGINYSGCTVTLGSNIDLSGKVWTPIGYDDTHYFGGVFDGNSKTITGLTLFANGNLGLFGVSKGNNELKNFTIDGASIVGNGDNSAIVSGVGFTTTFTGITVKSSTLLVMEGERIGGITGGNYPVITDCTVDSCSITGSEQVGAIAGYVCAEPVTGCAATNNTIVATVSRAGGLAGKLDFGDNAVPATISNNTISGTVVAPDNAGGICGQLMGNKNAFSIINNSIDVKCDASKSSPIGVLRSGLSPDFTGQLAASITGNTWTTETYSENTYTYTAEETGTTAQVIYNGSAPQ